VKEGSEELTFELTPAPPKLVKKASKAKKPSRKSAGAAPEPSEDGAD